MLHLEHCVCVGAPQHREGVDVLEWVYQTRYGGWGSIPAWGRGRAWGDLASDSQPPHCAAQRWSQTLPGGAQRTRAATRGTPTTIRGENHCTSGQILEGLGGGCGVSILGDLA